MFSTLFYYINITLTPKPFKDKMRKKSFRPILLLTQMHKFKNLSRLPILKYEI